MEFSARNIVIFWYTLYETQPAEAEENVENVAMLSNIREIHERKRHLALFAIVNIKAPFYKFIIWNCCCCCCWTRTHVCILKDIRSHTTYIYILVHAHLHTHTRTQLAEYRLQYLIRKNRMGIYIRVEWSVSELCIYVCACLTAFVQMLFVHGTLCERICWGSTRPLGNCA